MGSPNDSSGGIDPELGPISEPDEEDISPALRVRGEGSWQTPQDEIRERVRRETAERAARLGEQLNAGSEAGSAAKSGAGGLVLPVLMPPNIPMVPMELLFPPELVGGAAPVARELRGTAIVVGALDREAKTNTRLRIPSGTQARFGSLRVKVLGCYQSHPEDRLESWAYVEVYDDGQSARRELAVLPQRSRNRVREGGGETLLRKGWIIASSPSVTPIDHPVFDMWLLTCEGGVSAASAPAQLSQGISGQRRATGAARPASAVASGAVQSGEVQGQPAAQGANPAVGGEAAPDALVPSEAPPPAIAPANPVSETTRTN
jgi:hypothetical protein